MSSPVALAILQGFSPSKETLFHKIAPQVTQPMLHRIAMADYGHQAEHCLAKLQKIKKGGVITEEIDGYLHEVLELTRWMKIENNNDHWQRLFACTNLLLIAHGKIETMGENSTLANLLESILHLDKALIIPTIQLLAWRLIADQQNTDFYTDETPFFIYALLYLMLLQKYSAVEIRPIFEWLIDAEAKERTSQNWNPAFLLGISNFSQRYPVWQLLTQQLIPQIHYLEDENLKEELSIVLSWIVDYQKSNDN